MKNLMIALAALPLIFVSCSKSDVVPDDEIETGDKLYDVEFKAKEFSQSLTPMTIKSSLTNLNAQNTDVDTTNYSLRLIVYKDGQLVNSTDQKHGEENFGTFKLKLPAGKYQIGYLASSDRIQESSDILTESIARRVNTIYPDSYQTEFGTFRALVNNSVTYKRDFAEYNITQDSVFSDATLSAIHSKVIIKSTSSKPTNVKYVLVGVRGSSYIFPFWNFGLHGEMFLLDDIQINFAFDMDEEQYKNSSDIAFNMYQIDSRKSPLTISFYDSNKNILGTKTIQNFEVKQRHITSLEGDLYSELAGSSETGSSGFKAKVDKTYSDERINIKF